MQLLCNCRPAAVILPHGRMRRAVVGCCGGQLAQQVAEAQHTTYQLFSPWRHWTARGGSLEECILPPVEAWLEGILNAQCVVTDSFHGVAFSLIFGKPFVAMVNKMCIRDRC